jgi:hypothetical protein
MRDAKAAGDEIVPRFRLTEAERVSKLRGKLARMMVSSKPILALYPVFGILAVSAVIMILCEGGSGLVVVSVLLFISRFGAFKSIAAMLSDRDI